MLDVIRLEHLKIDCIVGVYPTERLEPQPLRVDLALHLDTRPAAAGAGLHGTVDYARLAGELRFLLISSQFLLLETAAEALCRYLLAPPTEDALHARPEEVTLKLTKPAALEGAIQPSLEVRRSRAELSWPVEDLPYGQVDLIHESRGCRIHRLRLQPGATTPLHEHRRVDQSELALGSELQLDGRAVEPGTGYRWPRGATHRWHNPSTRWQTLVCVERPSVEPAERVASGESPVDAYEGIAFFPPGSR
jgi:dihydroneopterin aldolase